MCTIFEELTVCRPVFCFVVRHGEHLDEIDRFHQFPNEPRAKLYKLWAGGREHKTVMKWLDQHEMPYFVYRLDTGKLLHGTSRETRAQSERPLLLVGGIKNANRAREQLRASAIYNDQRSEKLVDWWPSYLSCEFRKCYLRRELMTTTFGEILTNFDLLKMLFDSSGHVFVKTLIKQRNGFAIVSPTHRSEAGISVWDWERILSPDEPCLLSEVVAIAPKTEYRCFIVDGMVATTSRHNDNVFESQPQEYLELAQGLAKDMDHRFPRTYIVDIAKTESGALFVTEFNAIGTTGRFINNRIDIIADHLYGTMHSVSQAEYEDFQKRIDQCVN